MIYAFDMDGTIVKSVEKANYMDVKPIPKIINIINKLYDDGHTIKIFTSRGQTTGIDPTELLVKQLKEFHVKYHELITGKIHYDLLVDDKAVFSSDFIRTYKHLVE